MKKLPIKIVRCKTGASLPGYETSFSAGMDLRACISNDIVLEPMERIVIPTGLKIQLPEGYEAQIRPRSGLAAKKGIVAILGTIDADYRGEIGIILINLSDEPFIISPLDRVGQMVIKKYESVEWIEVDSLDESSRGENGFGSTGTK